MENVKAERGYAGPVVVCAVYFTPVSGYVATRPAIKYLVEVRDAEVWLAPIAGTRVLVPFRFSMPTPIGQAVLQATQFVSVALPPRAAPSANTASQPSRQSTQSTGAAPLTRRDRNPSRAVNLFARKRARQNRRFHSIWYCAQCIAICRGERSRTRRESPIRPRFVPDSFHTLSTGFSSVMLWYRSADCR